MKMNVIRGIICMVVLFISASSYSCQKRSQEDWREEVTSVLSNATTRLITPTFKPGSTSMSSEETPELPNGFEIPEGYIAGESHPLENPDAGEIPSISYGRNYILYGDYLYYPANYFEQPVNILSYAKLSDLVTADLTVEDGVDATQPVPDYQPVCNDPFCGHKPYNINNGVFCPLYFGVHREERIWQQTFYCLDYSESDGGLPVFYICAAEPEYEVIGEQVIETESKDVAVYRYDSATGKRTLLAEDLPEIYSFAQSGDYLYCDSIEGLLALDKTGKQVGQIESDVRLYHILDVEDDTLYICDELGNLYTADRRLTDVQQVFSYTFDLSAVDTDSQHPLLGDVGFVPPYGYMISDGYFYFCTDFKLEYQTEYSTNYSSSLYRLPLNGLNDTPELIVSGIEEDYIHGIYNGKVYYTPYEDYNRDERRPMTLMCVDANTKEVSTVISDGYDKLVAYGVFETVTMPIINDRFLIGRSDHITQGAILVYDLETGDYMYMSNDFLFA